MVAKSTPRQLAWKNCPQRSQPNQSSLSSCLQILQTAMLRPLKIGNESPSLVIDWYNDRQFIFNTLTFTIFVAFYFLLFSLNSHALCRGGSRGGCRGCALPPPPRDDLQFSNTTGVLQKKLCGLLVLK